MKKRIGLFILATICAFSIIGCTSKETVEHDVEGMTQTANFIISNFSQMSAEQLNEFLEQDDLELNLALLQTGLPIESESFQSMIGSWNSALEDCGTFVGIEEFEVVEAASKVELIAPIDYSDRDGEIVFLFTPEGELESLTINPEYAMSEILTKAGLNTLLGMGTVFAVLIFIAFIISLLKYIPALLEGKKKETKEAIVEVEKPVVAVEEVATTNELELIAVITAAIAAAEGTTTDGFVVRSIKRRKSNKWNA